VFLTPNVNTGGTPADRMQWAENFQMLFCLLAGLAVPPLLLFPDLAIRLLYANAFAPGGAFVLLFVGTEVMTLLAGTYQALVVALDRMTVHVVNNLLAQGCVVAAAWWLVKPLGIMGAGLAGLAAPMYLFMATMFFLHRAYGLRMGSRTFVRTVWLIVALLAAGLLGARTRTTLFEAVGAKAALYSVIVAGFALMLTPEERTKAWRLAGRWRPQ
jgi:O-antigen/teichoic acid export membrane protein